MKGAADKVAPNFLAHYAPQAEAPADVGNLRRAGVVAKLTCESGTTTVAND